MKRKLTYEYVKSKAEVCETMKDFRKNDISVYMKSLKMGWLKDFTWLKRTYNKRTNNWTYEMVLEESKNCSTIKEFRKKNRCAFQKARDKGWLKDFIWIKRTKFDLYKDKIDSVYSYEFIECNSVYIGRTLIERQLMRDEEHRVCCRDTVFLFSKENNIPIPKMKIIETNLTLKEGQEREEYWIKEYRKKGWTILNKAKAGGIGRLGKGKLNYKFVSEEARKYNTIKEFREANRSAYQKAKAKGWIAEYTWLEREYNPSGYWTYERVEEESKKYKTINEFRNGNRTAHQKAREEGWLNDFMWLRRDRKPKGYWNYEKVKEEASKYRLKSEFEKGSPSAYDAARINKWLNDFFKY